MALGYENRYVQHSTHVHMIQGAAENRTTCQENQDRTYHMKQTGFNEK